MLDMQSDHRTYKSATQTLEKFSYLDFGIASSELFDESRGDESGCACAWRSLFGKRLGSIGFDKATPSPSRGGIKAIVDANSTEFLTVPLLASGDAKRRFFRTDQWRLDRV